MPTYVCNFCGEDHGADSCGAVLCDPCLKPIADCICPTKRGDTIPPDELIQRCFEDLGEVLTEEQWEQVNSEFDKDQPIEMLAYIVANFPDPLKGFRSYIKELFPPPKDDGKVYNASRKLGNCYQFAFKGLLDGVADLDDGEVFLVHGFTKTNPTQYTGHAWLETDSFVVDCGAMQNNIRILGKEYYYNQYDVKAPKRFSLKEACANLEKLNNYGSWTKPPKGLPMPDEWGNQ